MAEGEVEEEARSLILESVRALPDRQFAQIDGIDTKAIQIFGAASVLLGFAGLAASSGGAVVTGLFIAAVASYLAAGIATYVAYRPRGFHSAPHPELLWTGYRDKPVAEVERQLITDVASAFSKNEAHIRRKSQAIHALLSVAGVEALFVAAMLIVSRFSTDPRSLSLRIQCFEQPPPAEAQAAAPGSGALELVPGLGPCPVRRP